MFTLGRWASIVFILVSSAVASPMTQLKGVITDSEGAAIRGARILVHWDRSGADVGLRSKVGLEKDLAIETDVRGQFTAKLPPGFYDIFVTATAFKPQCRKIRMMPGETAAYNVKLKPDPLVTKELGDTFPTSK